MATPSPAALYKQASREVTQSGEQSSAAVRRRYVELLREHGLIVPADHPDAGDPGLPCGWTPSPGPEEVGS